MKRVAGNSRIACRHSRASTAAGIIYANRFDYKRGWRERLVTPLLPPVASSGSRGDYEAEKPLEGYTPVSGKYVYANTLHSLCSASGCPSYLSRDILAFDTTASQTLILVYLDVA